MSRLLPAALLLLPAYGSAQTVRFVAPEIAVAPAVSITALPAALPPLMPAALAPVSAAPVAPAPALAPAPAASPVQVLRAAANPETPPRAAFDGALAPRIAVIGGGLAGLATVDALAKMGYSARLYEAEPRVGGRARSSTHAGTGLTVDEGAEFVSSTHHALLGLMKELGIKPIKRKSVERKRTYFYHGQPTDEKLFQRRLFKEARPQLSAIVRDEKIIRAAVAARDLDTLKRYDEATIEQYLDRISAPPILRGFVRSVVDSESGRDYRTLSSVVLFECLGIDLKARRIAVLPDEDEVYKISGGAGAIVAGLERRHADSIAREHRLTSLDSDDGRTFRLEFQTPDGPRAAEADYVVMALPQPALKDVAVRTPGFDEASRRAVESVEFGAHLKMTLFFAKRAWEKLKHSGGGFDDSGFAFWDSAEGQRGANGSITFLGRASAVSDKPGELAWKFLERLGRLFPGLMKEYRGFKLTLWPRSYPFADVPGHPYGYTLTYLNRRVPAKLSPAPLGNLFWAGDFFSGHSPAYMNGAVESGIEAARSLAVAAQGVQGGGAPRGRAGQQSGQSGQQ